MGWKPNDFEVFDFREFYNAWVGKDKQMQQYWQMSRLISFYAVAPHQDPKKAKIKKPQDLFTLPIDEKKVITKKQRSRIRFKNGKH